jgi:hypothetical protein
MVVLLYRIAVGLVSFVYTNKNHTVGWAYMNQKALKMGRLKTICPVLYPTVLYPFFYSVNGELFSD